ncbi:hypothetical protein B0J14DRAFT_285293 [Halenospora varia]|nr:hypothetical protein B0J14DRAFT_285293 [Halenospora varia]
MAPSRGLLDLGKARSFISISNSGKILPSYRYIYTTSNPAKKTQIYLSRSKDPYLNLSIEHYLLQKSPPESTILFLYTNRPSVILGRNQNPWTEVNLQLLRASPLKPDLVRRRSGGGTVFHDEGNVNYSVICPTSAFNRDKHAEMVVRALKKLNVEDVKVNERHDIVVEPPNGRPLKVSGSAYKLTRLRSLHHGTCLLNSPNLYNISRMLKSPAKQYITAKGVESVSSPIANVNVSNVDFETAVVKEFGDMYEDMEPIIVGEKEKEIEEIRDGMAELMSKEWIYGQTPQFTFDYKLEIHLTVRNSIIIDAELPLDRGSEPPGHGWRHRIATGVALFLKSNPKFPIYAVKWDKLFPPVNIVFKRARDTEMRGILLTIAKLKAYRTATKQK